MDIHAYVRTRVYAHRDDRKKRNNKGALTLENKILIFFFNSDPPFLA